jgi:hypothetical protein
MVLSMAASGGICRSSVLPFQADFDPKPLSLLVEHSVRSHWQQTSAASSRAYLLSLSSPMVPSDS